MDSSGVCLNTDSPLSLSTADIVKKSLDEKNGVYSVPKTPTGVQNRGREVHLGDFVKLYVNATTGKVGGYVGYVNENFDGHGLISSVMPDEKLVSKFQIQIFELVSSDESVNTRFRSGEKIPVLYGMPLVLVDQRKQTWNNKTGGLTGYIGPRVPKSRGELRLSFDAVGKSGQVVCIGDSLEIDIEDSNRKSNFYNHRQRLFTPKKNFLLALFKKKEKRSDEKSEVPDSPSATPGNACHMNGGYLVCDGKGVNVSFILHESYQHQFNCKKDSLCDVHVCGVVTSGEEEVVQVVPSLLPSTPVQSKSNISNRSSTSTSSRPGSRIYNTNDLVNMVKKESVTIDVPNMSAFDNDHAYQETYTEKSDIDAEMSFHSREDQEEVYNGNSISRMLSDTSSNAGSMIGSTTTSMNSSHGNSSQGNRSSTTSMPVEKLGGRSRTRSRAGSVVTISSTSRSSTSNNASTNMYSNLHMSTQDPTHSHKVQCQNLSDTSFAIVDIIAVTCLCVLLLSLSNSMQQTIPTVCIFICVLGLFGCYGYERIKHVQSVRQHAAAAAAAKPSSTVHNNKEYNPIDLRSHPNILHQVPSPLGPTKQRNTISESKDTGQKPTELENLTVLLQQAVLDNEKKDTLPPPTYESAFPPLNDTDAALMEKIPESLNTFKLGTSKQLELKPQQAYQLLSHGSYHFRNPSYSTLPVEQTPEGYNQPEQLSNNQANPYHRVPNFQQIEELREEHLGKWSHMFEMTWDQVKKHKEYEAFLSDEYVDMPARMIEAEAGNVELGYQRWFDILNWRQQNKLSTILITPYSEFEKVRQMCGHFFHGHDKFGHMIYVERPGIMKLKELKSMGFDEAKLQNHFLHNCEYQWNVLDGSANAKVLSILDMQGLGFMDMMGGANMGFAKKVSKLLQAYYPVRGFKIVIVNAPSWFNGIWKVISPLLHERTRAKTIVCNSDTKTIKATLEQYVDLENLPKEYGGSCTCANDDCTNHQMEEEYRTFMKYVNNELKL